MNFTRARALATTAIVAGMTLALATPALAHVTVNPDEVPRGGFAKLAFRVPNERDDASTVKLEVRLPADHPIANVSVKPKAGWTAEVTRAPLATPIVVHGSEVTEAVSQVTWTAAGTDIKPGEFDEFEVSVGPLPDDVDSLLFPAVQTYSDGEEVAWIEPEVEGQPEPELPAPVLRLTAANAGDHDASAPDDDSDHGDAASVSPSAASDDDGTEGDLAATPVATTEDGSDDGNGLAAAALTVGLLGVALSIVALATGRRRSS
ncbi:MAG: YcnI family copper-binding membrane protein [Acidimicrobiia bacterium]